MENSTQHELNLRKITRIRILRYQQKEKKKNVKIVAETRLISGGGILGIGRSINHPD